MQVNNNIYLNNPSFNAKIEYVGRKNLLPKKGLSRLKERVKDIGTDKDTIFIRARQEGDLHSITTYTNLWGMRLEVPNYVNWRTELEMIHVLQSKISSGDPKIIAGRYEGKQVFPFKVKGKYYVPDKLGVYKAICKHIDDIKTKFE